MQLRRHGSLALPFLMLVLSGAGCDSPESVREIVDRLGRGGTSGGGAVDGGSGGRTCGGPTDIKCAPSEYCELTAGTCGGGSFGVCAARPQACTLEYSPVCGCDGKTYGNDCARKTAGVSKQRDGECSMVVEVGEGGSCGGFRAPPQRVCQKGLACVDQPGRCGSMAADAPGVCQSVPTVCTKELRPVCGCDGKTYGNDCMRKAASVGLNHEGECRTPPGGGEGAVCAGIAGVPCARGFVCQPPPGSCKIADWQGTCTAAGPRPCPRIYKPVCGCDGKTYGNECTIQGTGVGIDHEGECKTPPGGGGEGAVCGGFAGVPCARGFVCQPPPNSCNVADWQGKCTAAGTRPCPAIYKPVCGCDGKTYGNDCALAGTGVGKAHDGECATMSRLLRSGRWGGQSVELTVRDPKMGATIEFDCARGTITGPLTIGPKGEFHWQGTYTPEGGPEPANGRPSGLATFHGTLTEGTPSWISIQVALSGVMHPPLRAVEGQPGRLIKCR